MTRFSMMHLSHRFGDDIEMLKHGLASCGALHA